MGADAARDIVTGNDVQVIREILFGEQSQRIGEHFSKLESLIASLQEENQQLRQALAAEAKARQEDNQARQAAIAELEGCMNERFQQAQQENAQQLEATREKHNLDMSRLVSLLASALAGYQEQTK